jgi:hypothetical protein
MVFSRKKKESGFNSDILNRYLNLNQAARKHELDKHLLLENGKLNMPIYPLFSWHIWLQIEGLDTVARTH